MSILNVNQIQPVGSGQTVTISAANITASSSTITANTFSGSLSSSGVSTFSDTVNVGAGKSIRLYGASSGYSDIIAAAGSASTTFTLPANGGSSGQYLQTNGSGGLSWQTVTDTNTQITRGTAATLSSSGAIYTGLPSGIRRITMTLWNVSMNATSDFAVRIGDSGGIESSGYTTWNKRFGGSSFSTAGGTSQSGFLVGSNVASDQAFFGHVILTNPQDNDWVCTSWISDPADNFRWHIGKKGLSGELDRIEIAVWSANSFDSGSVNIFYEV